VTVVAIPSICSLIYGHIFTVHTGSIAQSSTCVDGVPVLSLADATSWNMSAHILETSHTLVTPVANSLPNVGVSMFTAAPIQTLNLSLVMSVVNALLANSMQRNTLQSSILKCCSKTDLLTLQMLVLLTPPATAERSVAAASVVY